MTIWSPHIESGKTRYAAIVDALADDIGAGRLRPGDQLPTHRELADTLGVSIGTVTRAYNAAVRRGLIRGEIGRGTFVSGTRAEEYGAADFGLHAPGMIDLAVTRPLYHLDPDLGATLRDISRRPELQDLLHYQPNAGIWRHRAAGAQWAARFGVEVDVDDVLVCAGTQHALTVTLATACGPGDTLFVEELTYPGIRALATLLKLKLIPLAMDRDGLLPEAFESACRLRRAAALYTVPTIHNPVTATMPESRRREIAAIASRYGVAIVEDAIHHLLADEAPPPLWAFAPDNSYFIASMSKVVTGGIRAAYLVAPPGKVEALTHGIWATNWMAAPLCCEIAAMWIEDGTADETLRKKKEEARARVEIARDILSGFALRTDDCGHHAWLELPDDWNGGSAFAAEARRRGVAVSPADVFSVGGNTPRAVRLSLSAPRTRETLSAGLRKIERTLSGAPGLGPAIV